MMAHYKCAITWVCEFAIIWELLFILEELILEELNCFLQWGQIIFDDVEDCIWVNFKIVMGNNVSNTHYAFPIY